MITELVFQMVTITVLLSPNTSTEREGGCTEQYTFSQVLSGVLKGIFKTSLRNRQAGASFEP